MKVSASCVAAPCGLFGTATEISRLYSHGMLGWEDGYFCPSRIGEMRLGRECQKRHCGVLLFNLLVVGCGTSGNVEPL